MSVRSWWRISIGGYGSYSYFGTREEAEEDRDYKAEWEGGVGRMRSANEEEIQEGIEELQWQKRDEYPLDERQFEGLENAGKK